MKAYKSPRSNGFLPSFFQHFWDVIKVDVVRATRDFFKTRKMLKRINRMFIALALKIKDPVPLTDFRPIRL